MILERALEVSYEHAKTGKFAAAAYIKEKGKLPIYAFSKTDLRYQLVSSVGNVGYDCNFMLAKFYLKRRTDWLPRLVEEDVVL